MKIIRGRLSAADVTNPSLRYNPDTDQIQISPDGGVTWNPAPGSDPRHSTAYLKPPVAGSSKQCDAAANMTAWLKGFIDEMLFDFELVFSVTTIINSILLEFSFLGPYAEFLSIISELAETISGIGGTALGAAFTSDQYDLLTCIFFCNADVSGQVSAASLTTIEGEITDQLNTTAALITNALLSLQGEIGLSNAGAIGTETGDCSGCGCEWCLEIPLADSDFDMSAAGIPDWGFGASYSPGTGWVAALELNRGAPAEHASFFEVDRLMPDAHYTHVEIDVDITMGDTSIIGGEIDVYLGDVRIFAITSNTAGTLTWDGDITTSSGHLTLGRGNNLLGYNNTGGSAGGSGTWSRLLLKGTGSTNPFGVANNC